MRRMAYVATLGGVFTFRLPRDGGEVADGYRFDHASYMERLVTLQADDMGDEDDGFPVCCSALGGCIPVWGRHLSGPR